MELSTALARRAQELNSNSGKTSFTDSKSSTVTVNSNELEVFVGSLSPLVYRSPKYLPFYCKAARLLGFSRILELQAISLDPSVRNAEKVFWYWLKKEMATKENSPR